MQMVNSDAWRRAEIPAVNAHVTARSVADFYARLADGRVLEPVRLAEIHGFAYVAAELGNHDRSARLENAVRAVPGLSAL